MVTGRQGDSGTLCLQGMSLFVLRLELDWIGFGLDWISDTRWAKLEFPSYDTKLAWAPGWRLHCTARILLLFHLFNGT